MIGKHLEMIVEGRDLQAHCTDMLLPYARGQLAEPFPLCWCASSNDESQAVGAALRAQHYACIDDVEACTGLHQCLADMHSGGELAPGEILAGMQQRRRSDLMRWLPALGADLQPAIGRVLRAVDRLIAGLAGQKGLREELHGLPLQRNEVQATCYPGSANAHYVRHVDETGQSATRRVLTCIAYANPNWSHGDGGELRLHLAGKTVDITPRDHRVVIFFSDARVPHEVTPSKKDRYALSVWYHDMTGTDIA
uniref:Fe2OG dioxygenase domain-containing protein n=1 Tax=Coccolithus braarudii TaxID=221442 RepID=A0A7S0LGF3_9EUKA|mmetsp:Transcript_39142/g.83421  ORF Transcript_39142/g.83421 Transcript_39142/m.83421 type:complete len:252 (+) Transcript_39142:3-758(+)